MKHPDLKQDTSDSLQIETTTWNQLPPSNIKPISNFLSPPTPQQQTNVPRQATYKRRPLSSQSRRNHHHNLPQRMRALRPSGMPHELRRREGLPVADAHDADLRLVAVPVQHSTRLPPVNTPRHHARHFVHPALHYPPSSGPRYGFLDTCLWVRIAFSQLTAAAASASAPFCDGNVLN